MHPSPRARCAATALRHARPLAAAMLLLACGTAPPSSASDLSQGSDAGESVPPRADEPSHGTDAATTLPERDEGIREDAGVSAAWAPLEHFVCPGGGVAHRDPARPSCPECTAGLWRLDPERLSVRIAAGHNGLGTFYVGELPDPETFEFDAVEVYRGALDGEGNVPRAQTVLEIPWQPERSTAQLRLFTLIPVTAMQGDTLISGHCPNVKAELSTLPAEPAMAPVEPEGALVRGVWWHLAEVGWSCNFWCMTRDGEHPRAAEALYDAPDAAETCQTILGALGVAGTVHTVDRSDDLGLGLGCHTASDGSLGWARSPAFSSFASAPDARLVCGCSL